MVLWKLSFIATSANINLSSYKHNIYNQYNKEIAAD